MTDLHDDARALLDLWFDGAGGDALDPAGPIVRRWFSRDDAFDAQLRERFGPALARASRGELGEWCATPRGTLAFVILCDQIARNVHRDSHLSFATDPLALHTCLEGLAREIQAGFSIPERTFFCMPLMHSESLAIHDVARRAFSAILAHAEASAPAWVPYCKNTLSYEERHRVVIERFGRYPHRNVALGRAATDEEIEFLKKGVPF